MLARIMLSAVVTTVLAVPGFVEAAAFLDDFSGALDSEWTLTRTWEQGGSTLAVTYDTATNPGSLTWAFDEDNATGSNRVQTTLLRDDVTVAVGEYVQVQISINLGSGSSPGQLFGTLHVNQDSKTPGNESGFISLGVDKVNDGRLFLQVGENTVGSPITIGQGDDVYLRLTRTTATELVASYSLNGILFTDYGAPITITGVAAVGVHNGNASNAQFGTVEYDNFTIAAVPEPASLALMGLGGLMMVRRRG